jgi:hypothetical protein
MNLSLSPAMRRVLAVAILLALAGLVWVAAIRPLVGLAADRRADIAQLSARLVHLETVVARRSELERRSRERERQLAAAGGVWREASGTAVAATVQDLVRKAVGAAGGRVNSSAAAPEAVEHGFRRVSVHFMSEGTLDTLTRTLAAIEAARPALFADRLRITAPEGTAASGPPVLHFDLDVSGYLAGPRS